MLDDVAVFGVLPLVLLDVAAVVAVDDATFDVLAFMEVWCCLLVLPVLLLLVRMVESALERDGGMDDIPMMLAVGCWVGENIRGHDTLLF